ncbi:AhpC/TSA family protein [Flavobacterium sp. GSP27]|uniref:thioredoxin-dependent peroxiredoxin n=1 Tax=Flavobacterium bomense TaxID=2497483 RepID=A0A3S0MXQ3_9FLAO|nr:MULTISPECIES: peroxiredoxin-like family protein [Flavobacterium]RTY95594.1 AhpC/TSA family protein [Flavobacterium sp. GSN2]RTY76742.1 AhpC/TSA family protein [Flavobacterium sp. LS1R10]RTY83150.1 AhpC/TSA family protein [Flavobacterium sp. ZB4P23]RTY93026.1 AhpC/TSA family protein [Flavobacterium sp. RSP46]RTZ02280.1 AhpC/TSA family protein [Flavobacterium bomense]
MKKIICLALFTIGLSAYAQNNLPKLATEIAPLLIGEKIPTFTLKSVENKDVNVTELISKKRTVLVFYRGGWCPYCNAHLAALAEAEKELLDLGYQIIAISPDAPKSLKGTDDKEKLNYLLLSDSAGELSKAVGIAFQAPENYKAILNKDSEGVNSSFLPVPAVFILNVNAEIEFEYITPNFKNRISNDLLIAVAKSLSK